MKRISPILLSPAILLCIFIACGPPSPPLVSSQGIWITQSVIKKSAENKSLRNPNEQKMQSVVLELNEQFKENFGSLTIPSTVAAKEDLLQLSLAHADTSGRVFFYIYKQPSFTFKDFVTDLRTKLDSSSILPQDTSYRLTFVQARVSMMMDPLGNTILDYVSQL